MVSRVVYMGRREGKEHGTAPPFHKNPPLYTVKLGGGRKAEIRRRRIGLLFVLAA
ncbi:hypothetical protein KAX17_16300 [Candidatus Bipolaricaulota bacterium]|nr:hypothetical protein [Candidatus Bipolaricaulota bacterium]